MKNSFPILVALAALIAGASSCQKDAQKSGDRPVNAGALATACPTGAPTTTVTLSGVISSSMTLSNNTLYKLQGLVYVTSPVGGPVTTLTIQAGTRIEGQAGVGSAPGGGLIITRGARINAEGNPTCPIVFTSYRQSLGTAQSGDWAGVILLGAAPINTATGATTARVEGIPDNAPASAEYGGTVCTDTSGIFKYVRIEYAGFALSANNEINGLTLAGVGSGTVIDFVEAYKSNDDAFEFFGGTVNAKHLVSVDALDDMFDTDNGFRGSIQYALGMSDTTRADFSESNGIESDNNSAGNGNLPQTKPVFSNMTIIGLPNATLANRTNMPPTGTGLYGRFQIRRNSSYVLQNSVLLGFKKGIEVDGTASQLNWTNNSMCISHDLIHNYTDLNSCFLGSNPLVKPLLPAPASTIFYAPNGTTSTDEVADLKLKDPFNRSVAGFYMPVFSPQAALNSPALSQPTSSSCLTVLCSGTNPVFTFDAPTFRGAFGRSDVAANNWATGWTKFSGQ
ncbi:hypothetical protein F0L74_17395 [Chitinophaga agrisoli]|uniref:DUF5689 domain-containing protein n=1 Tax=Chitinophaga agrisoli TaxID=2607653 RepID=A0A5B2VPH9_9BACT|nr:hypothetical protein [Chitinophaga agrisoli]KAA2241653.1 hypothetical protein F0L74_17395 [Chitinophaga agrisoli]